jgi:hypothetical protein
MSLYVGIAALVALFLWLAGVGRPARVPAPEDDTSTPIDHEALAAAERELLDDPGARPIHEAAESDPDDPDDWGPGTPGRNRGPLPGIS